MWQCRELIFLLDTAQSTKHSRSANLATPGGEARGRVHFGHTFLGTFLATLRRQLGPPTWTATLRRQFGPPTCVADLHSQLAPPTCTANLYRQTLCKLSKFFKVMMAVAVVSHSPSAARPPSHSHHLFSRARREPAPQRQNQMHFGKISFCRLVLLLRVGGHSTPPA